MFLDFESLISLLHHHADINIQRFCSLSSFLIIFSIYSELWVICIFHPTSLIFLIFFYVYTLLNKSFIQLFQQIELTSKVYHRTSFALLINHKQRRNTCSACYISIVSTESRCDVYDTCTIFGCNVVTRNHTESLIGSYFPRAIFCYRHRFYPWNQLFVLHTNQVSTFVLAYHFKWNQFITWLIVFQCKSFCLFIKMSVQQWFSQYHCHLFARITIVSLYSHIVNLRTDTQSCIRRQCPRSSCPRNKIRSTPFGHFRLRVLHFKLSHYCCILHVTIAAWLVQLMRAQACTSSWRIRLNGIAFIQQSFLVKLLQ